MCVFIAKHSTKDMNSMLSKLQATYGPILRVKIGMEWIVSFEDVNDIERVGRDTQSEEKSPRPRPPSTGLLSRKLEETSLHWLE